jgi:predicted aconitase with swiveling domain
MTAGRGSSSGSSVLAEAIRLRTAPAAIVLQRRDAIVATGALVAWQLYGPGPAPVLLADIAIWPQLAAAGALVIEADGERASLEAR